MSPYRERLAGLISARGRLCVGIDPSLAMLDAWGLSRDAVGLERFARAIVEEVGQSVAVFKPQSAFFEQCGSAGIAVLERLLRDISEVGALSILDVKRGDIGSSMSGYADAFLAPDSPLAADAITLNPFLGFGSLQPAIDMAASNGRGIYVLARTSNIESRSIQMASDSNVTVFQSIIESAIIANNESDNCVGLVIGATHNQLEADLTGFKGSILAPGIGAQGGDIAALTDIFGAALPQVLPTASRSITGGGRGELAARVHQHLDTIAQL